MIAVISPAKTLDFEASHKIGAAQFPHFIDQAEMVMASLSKKGVNKLIKLQSISENLAELNFSRNKEWHRSGHHGGRQAVLAFKGDVYQGLQADEWTEDNMNFANKHLLILSGLYGVLQPSDLILPYRLEMGTDLTVNRRKNLYEFWKNDLKTYFSELVGDKQVIINLASQEYFRVLHTAGIRNPVIEIVFKDYSKGAYKIVSFFAKKARGLMANYIIQNKITSPEDLKNFHLEGYSYSPEESDKFIFTFKRKNS